MCYINKKLAYGFIWVLCLLFTSCEGKSQAKVRFEVRGLKIETSESEYATHFSHKATIVALGEGADTRQPYLVSVRVTRISGGDPELSGAYPIEFPIVVREGVGDLGLSGGSRNKKTSYSEAETWEPEKIKIELTGFIALTPIDGTAASSS